MGGGIAGFPPEVVDAVATTALGRAFCEGGLLVVLDVEGRGDLLTEGLAGEVPTSAWPFIFFIVGSRMISSTSLVSSSLKRGSDAPGRPRFTGDPPEDTNGCGSLPLRCHAS